MLEACLHQNGELRLSAVGSSMWPELRAGDELRLVHVTYDAIAPGDILLVHHWAPRENGEEPLPLLLAHRVIKVYIESGRAMLVTKGDRKAFADPPVFYEQVVGRVEEARRGGQLVYARELQRGARARAWGSRLQDALATGVAGMLAGPLTVSPEAIALNQLIAYTLDWVAVPALPAALDWEALYDLARSGRFTPMLSHKAIPGAPDWFSARCRRDLRENQAHRLLIDQQLSEVLARFEAVGLPVLVVKGPTHAEPLYPNPFWRPMVDLDLLVAPEDWDEAMALLEASGFLAEHSDWARLTERLTGQVALLKPLGPAIAAIELHRDLKMLSERLAVRGEVDARRAWQEAVTLDVNGSCVATLAPEDALAYASTHWAQHHFYNSVWLLDIALMAGRPGLDWQKLVDDARTDGTASFIWLTLSLARHLYAAPVPVAALRALAPDSLRVALITQLAWARVAGTFAERADVRSLLLQLLLVDRWRWAFGGLWAGLWPTDTWLRQHYVAASGEKASRLCLLTRHWRRLGRMLLARG
ncbi:MAG: nucleotidyltransferase family protein [Candidatus Sericytochromatia bacterium]|nr:nucleotidyltransferase family protein [Candidatus Sericytochromatia bacterium]